MKEARVSWNKPMNAWVIRYWSDVDHEWNDDSYYPVKDVNPETEMGFDPEEIICRMYDLQDLGYSFTFVK